jgi:hypothetical protein
MAAGALSPSDIDTLQKLINNALRMALGVSSKASGDMLHLSSQFFGFGRPTLLERYVDVITRTIQRTLNSADLPGQLGRASLDRSMRLIGSEISNVLLFPWNDLKCPWLRKLHILYHAKVDISVKFPSGIGGGQPDNILRTVQQTSGTEADNSKKYVTAVSRLWQLNINSISQITIPGTNKLFSPESFKTSLNPTKQQLVAYKTIFTILMSKPLLIPMREEGTLEDPEDDLIILSQAPTSQDTSKTTRSGRIVYRPLHPDEIPDSSQPQRDTSPPRIIINEPEQHRYTAPHPHPPGKTTSP